MNTRVQDTFRHVVTILPLLLIACPAKGDYRLPLTKRTEIRRVRCWHDPSVLNVKRIFPNRPPRGDIALEEILKGSCSPKAADADELPFPVPEFYRFYSCRSDQRRLVYREPLSGRVTRVISATLPKREFVDDVLGLRYTTLIPGKGSADPPLVRHGPTSIAANESNSPLFPMARGIRIWAKGRPLLTIKATKDERITCAKLIPGTDYVAVCFQEVTSAFNPFVVHRDDQLTLSVIYNENRKARGSVRIYRINDGKRLGETTYQYLPSLRQRGPCAMSVLVPQGLFSSTEGKLCEEYYRACQKRPFISPCDSKRYKRNLPRAFDMVVSPSPDGRHLAVLAFDDLFLYRIKRGTSALSLVANYASATYLNRDWHILKPRLRWSAKGTTLILFGEGRIIRLFSGPGFKVKDFKIRSKNRCCRRMCRALVASAYLDERSQIIAYSRPDYGIGLNWTKMALKLRGFGESGIDMKVLSADRLYATVQGSWNHGDGFHAWAQDIVLTKGKMLLNAAGVVFRVDIATGRTECFMGVRSPYGFFVRW